MKRLWIAGVIGALFGACFTEAFHRAADNRSREQFEMTVRCRHFADEFVRKDSSDYNDVMLNEVRFSPARNECVASIDEVSHTPPSDTWRYSVVDVLSGESIFSDLCVDDKQTSLYCGAGRNMQIRTKRDDAFKAAVN